jgi:hypothetical protein
MRNSITVPVYTNRDQIDVSLPARWAICQACEGCATDRGAGLECDGPYGEGGNGFTASEWADRDDDFKADYLAGRYDRPCAACDGLGRVQTIDDNAVTGWRERILLKAYLAQERDSRAIDDIHAAERRMGA